jgi:hypothetical protein
MSDLEHLDDVFDMRVNPEAAGSVKRKLAGKFFGKNIMTSIKTRPKWQKQLSAIKARKARRK